MERESPVSIVSAWQKAANERDSERLAELSHPEIAIAGPRGSGYGHGLLRDWLDRAGLTLQTRRLFAFGDVVVAEQHGTWRSTEDGEVVGESEVACLFRVAGGQVAYLYRYEDLDAALADAGLGYTDEVDG